MKSTIVILCAFSFSLLLLISNINGNPKANSLALQTGDSPVNLSHSGAASQPRVVAGLEGVLQAFWIDHFDGLMTSIYDGVTWSKPVPAPLPASFFQKEAGH